MRIEEELKVRYDAEEMWTGFKTNIENLETLFAKEALRTSQLTSNPSRVWWLLKKLKDLKEQRFALEKNSAFRPTVSQVSALVKKIKVNYFSLFCNLKEGHSWNWCTESRY